MELSALYDLFRQHPTITTDTRHCPTGSLFFALRGANFDGNTFARQALEAGCAYAVVEDPKVAEDEPRCLLVDDVLTTMQQLAQLHRQTLNTPILQITGTNGKTTTKELTAAVLAEKFNVLFTEGNLNNHIGVPKTLLRLTPEHEFAVIETGANHPGEIAQLSEIVQPNCGLITNVGKAHLEGFGSFEGVIATKTELYRHIRATNARHTPGDDELPGFIFLHGDNPYLVPLAEGLPTLTYGSVGRGYNVEGEVLACTPFLSIRWRKQGSSDWHKVQTQLIGAYNLDNILAAILVGLCFKVPMTRIDHALSHYTPTNNRSEFRQTAHNRLIVDAYNANLSSMQAALENFRQISDAHKMLILGEMRELGSASATAHTEVANLALTTGAEEVWFVGEGFAHTLPKVIDRSAPRIRYFSEVATVQAELKAHPLTDRLILIKGSNGTKLFLLPELL